MSRQPKAESVFALLRADILAGRFAPGARLRYTDLCERYATSMGVARESMLRLAEQGLVRGEPQHGFSVVPLSIEELTELTDTRIEIESVVLRHAVAEGDLDWEARLLAAHHRLDRTPLISPSRSDDGASRLDDGWAAAHKAFHDALLDGCANRRLRGIASSLRDAAELYRSWSLPFGDHAARDVQAEHRDILHAALARDVDEGVRLLVDHIRRTTDSLLASPAGLTAAMAPEEPVVP